MRGGESTASGRLLWWLGSSECGLIRGCTFFQDRVVDPIDGCLYEQLDVAVE